MKNAISFLAVCLLALGCSKNSTTPAIPVVTPKTFTQTLDSFGISTNKIYTLYMYSINPKYTQDSIIFNSDSTITESMYQLTDGDTTPYFYSVATYTIPIMPTYLNSDTFTIAYNAYKAPHGGITTYGNGILARILWNGSGGSPLYFTRVGDSIINIGYNPQATYNYASFSLQ